MECRESQTNKDEIGKRTEWRRSSSRGNGEPSGEVGRKWRTKMLGRKERRGREGNNVLRDGRDEE